MSIVFVSRRGGVLGSASPQAVSIARQDYAPVAHIAVVSEAGTATAPTARPARPGEVAGLIDEIAADVVAVCEPCDAPASADVCSAVMAAFAANDDVDVVYGRADAVDGSGRFLRRLFVEPAADRIAETLQHTPALARPAVFWRRRALALAEPLLDGPAEAADYDLWTRLAASGARWLFLDRPLARIRTTGRRPAAPDPSLLAAQAALAAERFGYVHWRWLDAIARADAPAGEAYDAALAAAAARLMPPERRAQLATLAGEGPRATLAFLEARLPLAAPARVVALRAGPAPASPAAAEAEAPPQWPRLLVIDHTRMGDGSATGEIKETLFGDWPRGRIMQISQKNRRRLVVDVDGKEATVDVPGTEVPGTLADAVSAFAPDVVLYRPVPESPALHMVAMRLIEALGRPLVTWIMDDWPARLAHEGAEPHLEPDFRRLAAGAAANLSISRAMSTAFGQRYGVAFEAVANAVDPAEWPLRAPEPRREFLLRYSGSLADNMGLDSVLCVARAVEALAANGIDIRFEINTRKYWLERCAALLSGFRFTKVGTETLDRADYRAWMQAADCNLIAYNFDEASRDYVRYSMANKLPECLISGAALLAHGPADVATMAYLDEIDCGYRLNEPSDEAMVDLIRRLVADPAARRASVECCRGIALERHSLAGTRRRLRERIAAAARTRALRPAEPAGAPASAHRWRLSTAPLDRRVGAGFDEAAFARALLARGRGVLVDVGAHHGAFLAPFARDGWSVLAFEPDQTSRTTLAERFGGDANVTIRAEAVSDASGRRVPFYASDEGCGISSLVALSDRHRPVAEVETVSLADALAHHGLARIDLLKIDVETHEMAVLRGFPWDRVRPDMVMVAFEDRSSRPLGFGMAELAAFLRLKGYALLVSERHPVEHPGTSQAWRRITHLAAVDPSGCGDIIAIPAATRPVDVVAAIRASWQDVPATEPTVMVQTLPSVAAARPTEAPRRAGGVAASPVPSLVKRPEPAAPVPATAPTIMVQTLPAVAAARPTEAPRRAGGAAAAGATPPRHADAAAPSSVPAAVPAATRPVDVVAAIRASWQDVPATEPTIMVQTPPAVAAARPTEAPRRTGGAAAAGATPPRHADAAAPSPVPAAVSAPLPSGLKSSIDIAARRTGMAAEAASAEPPVTPAAASPVPSLVKRPEPAAPVPATAPAVASRDDAASGRLARAAGLLGAGAVAAGGLAVAPVAAVPATALAVVSAVAALGAVGFAGAAFATRQIGRRSQALEAEMEARFARFAAEGRAQAAEIRSQAAQVGNGLAAERERRAADLVDMQRQIGRDIAAARTAGEAALKDGLAGSLDGLRADMSTLVQALTQRVDAAASAERGLRSELGLLATRIDAAAGAEGLGTLERAVDDRIVGARRETFAEMAALRDALEVRLADFGAAVADKADVERLLAELAARLDALAAERSDLAAAADLAALSTHQDAERQRLRQDLSPLAERLAAILGRVEQLESDRRGMARAEDVAGSLDGLRADMSTLVQALTQRVDAASAERGLRSELGLLATRIDAAAGAEGLGALERAVDDRIVGARRETFAEMAALRDALEVRLADFGAAVADKADVERLVGLLRRLEKLEMERPGLARTEDVAAIRTEVDGLSSQGRTLGERFQAVEPELARVKAGIAESEAARRAEQEAVQRRLSELRGELGALHQRYGGLDELAQRLDAGDGELRQRLSELRGELGALSTHQDAERQRLRQDLSPLAERLAAILGRLEKLEMERPGLARTEDVAAIRTEVDGLSSQGRTLGERFQAVEPELARVKAGIAGARHETFAEMAALRDALEVRLADFGAAVADKADVERLLAELAARLDALAAERSDLAAAADLAALSTHQDAERQRLRQDLAPVAERLVGLLGRLEKLEMERPDLARTEDVAAIRTEVDGLSSQGRTLGERFQAVEPELARVKAGIAESEAARRAEQEAVQRRLSELLGELGALHQRYGGLDELAQRLDAGDGELRQRLSELHRELGALHQRYGGLDELAQRLDAGDGELRQRLDKLVADMAAADKAITEARAAADSAAEKAARVETKAEDPRLLGALQNRAVYQSFNRRLRPEHVKALQDNWLRRLSLPASPNGLAYLADRICVLEGQLRGRLATSIEDAVLRSAVAKSIKTDPVEILEIGTLFGIGGAMLHEAVASSGRRAHLTLLDPLEGYYSRDSLDIVTQQPVDERTLRANLALAQIPPEDVTLIKAFSTDADALAAASERRYDMLVIDGNHSYSGVAADFRRYGPLVRVGGYILFDDYGQPDWPDVKRYVDDEMPSCDWCVRVGIEWRTAVYGVVSEPPRPAVRRGPPSGLRGAGRHQGQAPSR